MRVLFSAMCVAFILASGTSGATDAAPPLTVVLTSESTRSLPAPERPYARVVLSMTRPRPRKDGYLVSALRVQQLVLPEHRSYFIRIDFGSFHKDVCEGERCRGAITWIYSPRKLAAMRRYGAWVEAFIHAPSGHIWSVAGGSMDLRGLLPRGTSASAVELSAELTPSEVPRTPTTRTGARGTFTASVWPYDRKSLSVSFGLRTRNLTGHALSAHIHTAAPGRIGPVLVELCSHGRCNLTAKTLRGVSPTLIETMRLLGAYVDVHTRRNPRGELRGQIEIRERR